jgi:acyl-coenzyme A synthetase/AMP-(fatty) acid ligase
VVETAITSIVDDVLAVAARMPDQVAVVEPSAEVCYRELAEQVDVVTARLADHKLRAGDLVQVRGPVSATQLACVLAAWRHCAVVWLDAADAPATSAPVRAAAPPSLSVDVRSGEVELGWTTDLPTDVAAAAGRLAAKRDDILAAGGGYLVHSSGSTGRRKVILGSLRSLSAFVAWQRGEFGFGQQDRVAALTNVDFDVVYRELFSALTSGATLVCPLAGLRPSAVLPWLAQTRCNIVHVVPSLARFWLGVAPDADPPPSAVRLTFFAGEPLDAHLPGEWRARTGTGQVVVNLYGPSETTLAKFYHRVPRSLVRGVVPVGRPLPGTSVEIRHPETGAVLADGDIGEVVIVTPHGSLGYLGDHVAAADAFRRDGAIVTFRTGDLGTIRPDGLVLLGRLDSRLKINGVWVNCHDVEATLRVHEAVEDAAVLAVRIDQGVRLHAFVAVTDPQVVPSLRSHVRQRLGTASVPGQLTPLDGLPRLHNGKLDRPALRRIARGVGGHPGRDARTGVPDPAELTGRIVALAGSILRVAVAADQNLLHHGLDLLAAQDLAAAVADEFPAPCGPRDVLDHPSPRELGDLLLTRLRHAA